MIRDGPPDACLLDRRLLWDMDEECPFCEGGRLYTRRLEGPDYGDETAVCLFCGVMRMDIDETCGWRLEPDLSGWEVFVLELFDRMMGAKPENNKHRRTNR